MLLKKQLMEEVNAYLSWLPTYINLQNSNSLFDVNIYCENLFCKLLNIIYGLNLIDLNQDKKNYPAVDLGDYEKRVCFQVTSRNDINKIKEMLEKFSSKELYKYFDELYILILGRKLNYRKTLDTYDKFHFDISNNVWDLMNLSQSINNLEEKKINEILDFFRKNIPGLNISGYNRDKQLFQDFDNVIRGYIKYFKDPEQDVAFTPTNIGLISGINNIILEWQMPDKRFLLDELEIKKQLIISYLCEFAAYLSSPVYFTTHPVDGFIMPNKDPERTFFNEMKNETFNLRKKIIQAHEEFHEIIKKF